MTNDKSYYFSGKFLQRSAEFFCEKDGLPSDNCLCAAFNASGKLYVGTDNGLAVFNGKSFDRVRLGKEDGAVTELFKTSDGSFFAVCGSKIYKEGRKSFSAVFDFDENVVACTVYNDIIFVATASQIYRIENKNVEKYFPACEPVNSMAYNGKYLYLACGGNLVVIKGKRRHWHSIIPEMSGLPDTVINSIQFDSLGYLWLATDDGLITYDALSTWVTPSINEMLPAEKIYSVTTVSNGARWLGTNCGVICQFEGENKYLVYGNYVPDSYVKNVAVSSDGNKAYAVTAKGVSEISCQYMTLAEKAAVYQEQIEKYHDREGYILGREHVENRDYSSGRVHISDNDGLWTQRYVASQSYRYAVTKDKAALENARRSMKKMLYLMTCTGIKGFTARAIRREGEPGYGNGNHEWHLSADGSCEWKGETSSDEMTGHFYGMTLYYKFCANASEKKAICKALCDIMDHIIENDYRLCDTDGLPTTWANWSPESLNGDDKWSWERGINSLEILAFLKTCYRMSGNEKYNDEYRSLVKDHHYGLNILNHKMYDGHTCHIDDNLSFLATSVLLEWEDDVDIRRLVLMGFERSYNYEKIERVPSWYFAHAAFTGRYSDIENGVQTLREFPLKLYNCEFKNSLRKNLVFDDEQEKWGESAQLLEPLPADERPLSQDDGNPFLFDMPDRHSFESPVLFLLPYWFAKYYGLISE